MIKKFPLTFYLIFFFFNFINLNASASVSFIDLDYIFINSSAGKKFQEKLENDSKKIENKLKNEKKIIEDKKQQLSIKKNILSNEEYNKEFKLIEEQITLFNIDIQKLDENLKKINNEAKNLFLNEINKILTNYAKINSIDLIINKKNVVLGSNKFDITDDILIRFDKDIKELIIAK